jgi:hypothetical protein
MLDRFASDAPVLCEACDADAFAIAATREETITGHVHLELRCGACGRWQTHTLSFRAATRFREHHDETRRQITRVLVSMMRAESLGG